ncbi:hypothetical protein [Methanimicrococcus hongohii]|uniref:hypothetical protein n=1 Tax=Methanimicrococcus hongohii TaxID=3028295 RepID=UPI002930B934|nr:hypothetical protein [Methanimicrococcus sp. Hf6]
MFQLAGQVYVSACRSGLCFTVAGQVCVAACICSFYRNLLAFVNVPPLPYCFCFRCYLTVSVSAATLLFLFPLPVRFAPSLLPRRFAGSRTRCRRPRKPHKFLKSNQK